MTIINLPNPTKLIIQGGFEVLEWRESIQTRPPGYFFTKAFKKGYWDGWLKPGKLTSQGEYHKLVIGRGFLNSFRAFLRENNFNPPKYKLGFSPIEKPNLTSISDEIWDTLRDYQQESLEEVISNRWGRIALATNAGKGAVIALTAQVMSPHKTIILADEISVFQTLDEELHKWINVDIGKVESGQNEPPEEDVVLCMAPTLYNRLRTRNKGSWISWLNEFSVMLVDEADKATSKTWRTILDNSKNSQFRIGFSGSFPDEDTVENMKLEETFGPELVTVKNMQLVERNISAKPLIHIHTFKTKTVALDTEDLDRHGVYNELVVNNEKRNKFLLGLLDDSKLNAIVVDYIEHGNILNELIPNSRFIHGSCSKEERLSVLNDFIAKKFNTLITTNILDRGSNMLGTVGVLIFASGSGSDRQVLQRIGRGLRRGGGKRDILIYDIYDTSHKYLKNASDKRLDVYEKEYFDINFVNK